MTTKLKLKKAVKVIEYSATERLLDEAFVASAIRECLNDNDSQGAVEIIETHLKLRRCKVKKK